MGHNSNVKLLRRQIRNVAQEQFQGVLTQEAFVELDKRMTEHAGQRLDEVAKNVEKELRKMDGQNMEFRRLLMKDAGNQISGELFGINVTMLSWQQVMMAELGIKDIADFEAKVEAKKKEIIAKFEADAKERAAKEEAELKAKEAAAAAAEVAKAAEVLASSTGESGKPVVLEESSSEAKASE